MKLPSYFAGLMRDSGIVPEAGRRHFVDAAAPESLIEVQASEAEAPSSLFAVEEVKHEAQAPASPVEPNADDGMISRDIAQARQTRPELKAPIYQDPPPLRSTAQPVERTPASTLPERSDMPVMNSRPQGESQTPESAQEHHDERALLPRSLQQAAATPNPPLSAPQIVAEPSQPAEASLPDTRSQWLDALRVAKEWVSQTPDHTVQTEFLRSASNEGFDEATDTGAFDNLERSEFSGFTHESGAGEYRLNIGTIQVLVEAPADHHEEKRTPASVPKAPEMPRSRLSRYYLR